MPCHQELLCIRRDHQKEVDSVVNRMTEQYKAQLTSVQSSLQNQDLEHKLEVQKLQEKIQALEVSLAGQGASNLPSVGVSQQVLSSTALWDEVFNIIPGTVNQRRGAAQYNSQDQAFSFQKQVRFEQGSSPDLGSTASPDPGLQPQSSMPHSVATAKPNLRHLSQIPFQSGVQDAATIAMEVSAATAAQASKEFWHMREPKITKLKGGYSSDAKLIFRSWQADVLVHIQDCELDNQATLQLIKDQTQDSARHEV